MITKADLYEAIAECQGVRDPKSDTCIKLAAFYTILDHVEDRPPISGYSYAEGPTVKEGEEKISYTGKSEFAKMIFNRNPRDIWPIIDELVQTVAVLHPKLYNSLIQKLQ